MSRLLGRLDVRFQRPNTTLRSRPRWLGRIVVSCALAVGVIAPALAQVPPDASVEPIVGFAPRVVGFSKGVVIKAHVNGGVSGDEIDLERKFAMGSWKAIRDGSLNEERKIEWRLKNPTKSAFYRIRHVPSDTTSEAARVIVRPRLKVRVRPRHAFVDRKVKVVGSLWPTAAGRRVLLQRKMNGQWRTIGRPHVRKGRWSQGVSALAPGRWKVRVVFGGDSLNPGARRTRRLTIYEADPASWYGPGFYGQQTACGRILSPGTLGVAHRTLPCGTKVSFLFNGRTVTVPVIDRGPYGSSEWDLTGATAARLGFSGRGSVGSTH
jgi:rare lipoprotein A